MIAAIVSYPSEHPTTNVPLKFDMNYYLATHMPMIERGWGPFGLRSWSTVTFDDPCPLTGKKPRYRVQTTCIFGNVEELKAALAGNEETKKDVDKFCNVFPEIAVAEVGEGNTVGDKAKEE